ncbi:BatD family protein [Aureimonas sp. Leaf454]|uniref:BatD family protein n=1 Tax=Aureimonas sp. Leaf454 TaxID=1736381 RepID=UPI00138EF364|nr:BatD family protein [Aureimonas sp. Leaf454]
MTAMRLARLLLLVLLASGLCASLARAGDRPPEAFGEVTFEMPDGGAYAQEMITMVVRFYFKARATTEAMEQPDLAELGWTQLGRDTWAPTTIGSVKWFGVTRRIAVFAPEAKTYEIPPFVHHVTLIDAEDKRWKVDAVSKPVQLTIRKWTGRTDGPEDEDTWWLPARSIEIRDSWTVDPATLKAGQATRRRLEVTAVGTIAEQLPPAIDTQSPGLVIFPGPVERRTEIVDGMPVAQAVYTYDIRPHTGDPVILREVLVPWFDVAARQMRQAIVPGANVGEGMVVPGQPTSDLEAAIGPRGRLAISLGAGIAAFALGAAILLAPGRRDREPVPRRLSETLRRLRRLVPLYLADWSGKPPALRAAVHRLALEDGELGRRWLADPAVTAAMAAVDAGLFGGRGDGTVPPAVAGRLTDRVVEARRRVFREAARPAEPSLAADAFGR